MTKVTKSIKGERREKERECDITGGLVWLPALECLPVCGRRSHGKSQPMGGHLHLRR